MERETKEKETRYILYDSVIAFPRTNIAPAERTQENVDVNRCPFFLAPPFSLSFSFFPSRNPSSFVTTSEFLRREDICKALSPPFRFSPPAASAFPRFSRILVTAVFKEREGLLSRGARSNESQSVGATVVVATSQYFSTKNLNPNGRFYGGSLVLSLTNTLHAYRAKSQ